MKPSDSTGRGTPQICTNDEALAGLKLDCLFPSGVSVFAARAGDQPQAHFAEQEYIAGKARSLKRRQEFLLGRGCAQAAMAAIGIPSSPILPSEARAPVWPTGLVGSISHCQDYGIAAVANVQQYVAIGIDIEGKQRVSHAIRHLIVSQREAEELSEHLEPDLWLALSFSAKESAFKALFPIVAQNADFLDFEVSVSPTDNAFGVIPTTPKGQALGSICGRYTTSNNLIVTSAWLQRAA